MASKVSPPNPDLPRQSTPSPLDHLLSDHHRTTSRGSFSFVDDLFGNICSDNGNGEIINGNGSKTVWREIISGGNVEPKMMSLEFYLAKAGVVNREDVGLPAVVTMPPRMDAGMMSQAAGVQFAPGVGFGMEFGNGMAAATGGGGGGRVKRTAAVEEAPPDKATQRKQRRMIKNRESAARSRERKQAYTVELESLVRQLEEDNARLLKQEVEMNKERYKQLMENLIPVVEKRKPPRVMRRVRSMEW